MVGWLLTLPAAGAVGALAALIVVWLPAWGILIDTILAVLIIAGALLALAPRRGHRSERDERGRRIRRGGQGEAQPAADARQRRLRRKQARRDQEAPK